MQRFIKKTIVVISAGFLMSCGGGGGGGGSDPQPEPEPPPQELVFKTQEALGEALFNETNLSLNRSMSCATCHDPNHAFVDVRDNEATAIGVSLGDDNFSIGVRNAPTASYAQFAPVFQQLPDTADPELNGYMGGQFHDGRAADLKGQAGGPPLDSVEMMMPDKASVVARIQENENYVAAFKEFYGENIFDDVDNAYLNMTVAIGKFEKTDEFAPFDSKWDKYLRGEYTISFAELTGKSVFFSPANSSCVNCHQIDDIRDEFAENQTFTNYKYFNLGVPDNTALISAVQSKGLHAEFVANGDQGLFGHPDVNDPALKGKYKTPTLRNIAVTGPYMHNGVFKELKTVLDFYDFRGNVIGSNRPNNPETGAPWGETTHPSTIDFKLLGQTPMSDAEIDGLECFLRLLTDERYEHLMPPLRDGLDCS